MNNVSYYPYSLTEQAQGGDLTFQYPFATSCKSKVREGLWSLKNVFAYFNKGFELLLLTKINNILTIISHFFPRRPMVFIKSTSTRQFLTWEGLISLTTFLYRHKLTWQVDVQGCKKLHATVWQKLITVAKGKAKIEMSPFSWLYKFPLKHI